ncbi:AraC-type DNA-binding protein [Paenibacillus sp. OV219]|nr:AraC-type DNA-binding protein [Paenibacillus sp. OV219]
MFAFRCTSQLGKARCEKGWDWSPKLPLHDYDLWYAMEGKGEMFINGTCYPVSKGSCFLIRPGDRVHAEQDEEQRLTVIYIHFTIQEGSCVTLPGRHVKFEDTRVPETCLQRIVDLQLRGEAKQDEEFDLLIRLVIVHMLRQEEAMASPVSTMHKQLIHKVIDRLADDEKSISIAALAAEVNVSPRYLSHLFKKYTGYSLKAYITHARMEHARFLLAETTMNITEVAAALEFTDIYHFSKLFKQHYGASPSRFRFIGRGATSHYGDSTPEK